MRPWLCALWVVLSLACAHVFETAVHTAEAHADWLAQGAADPPAPDRTVASWSKQRGPKLLSLGLLALSKDFLAPVARTMLCAGTLGIHRGHECRGVSSLQYVPGEGHGAVTVDGVVVHVANDARRVIFAYRPRAHAGQALASDVLRDALARAEYAFKHAVLPWLRSQKDPLSWQQVHVGGGDGGSVAALVASRVLTSVSLPFAALGVGNALHNVCVVSAALAHSLPAIFLPHTSPIGAMDHVVLRLGAVHDAGRSAVDSGATIYNAPLGDVSTPVVTLRDVQAPMFSGVGFNSPDVEHVALDASVSLLTTLHIAASALPSALRLASFTLYGGAQRASVSQLSALVQRAIGQHARVECTHAIVGLNDDRSHGALNDVGLRFGARCEVVTRNSENVSARHPLAQFLARIAPTFADRATVQSQLDDDIVALRHGAVSHPPTTWDTCFAALVQNVDHVGPKRAAPIHILMPAAKRSIFLPSDSVSGALFQAVDGALDTAEPASSEELGRMWASPLGALRQSAPDLFLLIASTGGIVFPDECNGVIFGPRPSVESQRKAALALCGLVPALRELDAARPAIVGGRILASAAEASRHGAGIFSGASSNSATIDFARASRNAVTLGGARLSAAVVRVLATMDVARADVRDCTAANASWVRGWCPAECLGAGDAVRELCSAVVHVPQLGAYAMGVTTWWGNAAAARALAERTPAEADSLVLHFVTRWYRIAYGNAFALLFNRTITDVEVDAVAAI